MPMPVMLGTVTRLTQIIQTTFVSHLFSSPPEWRETVYRYY